MNQKLQFVPTAQHPAKTSIWDTLPAAPEGWERAAGCDTTLLFHKLGTDQHVVWNVTAGRFHDAHAFCCDAAKAQEEYAARCR